MDSLKRRLQLQANTRLQVTPTPARDSAGLRLPGLHGDCYSDSQTPGDSNSPDSRGLPLRLPGLPTSTPGLQGTPTPTPGLQGIPTSWTLGDSHSDSLYSRTPGDSCSLDSRELSLRLLDSGVSHSDSTVHAPAESKSGGLSWIWIYMVVCVCV